MVSEKKTFEVFFHYKSMEANEHPGKANSDPRDMAGRIYVARDHFTLLDTKYLSSVLYGFREEDFWRFLPNLSLWELMVPGAWPTWSPGAWLAGIM